MTHPNFKAEHANALKQETLVSTAINALLPAAIIWFLDVTPPQTLVGPHDILGAIVPASGLASLVMTLVLTAIVRQRVKSGMLCPFEWPKAERGVYRFVPRNLLLRAVVLGLAAVILLVPITFALVAVAGILPLSKLGALAFNIAFGMLVGLTMTRFVVLPALADEDS
jgi:hypothetical protein